MLVPYELFKSDSIVFRPAVRKCVDTRSESQ